VSLKSGQWTPWFESTQDEALGLLVAPATARFDLSEAQRTDQWLDWQTGR